MPNKHKTPMVGWNPSDPALKPWIKAEAERRGVDQKVILDEALTEYRERHEAGGNQVNHKTGEQR